ncbi:unnamed protein product, partial [Phaeothamnion confervicola]
MADALLRSPAVLGSLQMLGSPTVLLSEWAAGVYDLFALPIRAIPQGPLPTLWATGRGVASLLRHASAGTLSSLSGLSSSIARNLTGPPGGRRGLLGAVARPIVGTMDLVFRTSQSLMERTGVDSALAAAASGGHRRRRPSVLAGRPAPCRLNRELWFRWTLLPPGHELVWATVQPVRCGYASYAAPDTAVSVVLSDKSVLLFRGAHGCEKLWKRIEYADIVLLERGME